MFELSAEKLTALLVESGKRIWEYVLEQEAERSGQAPEAILEEMDRRLGIMEESAEKARREPVRSVSGLTGGNSFLYSGYCREGRSILGSTISEAAAMALSAGEVNASMDRVVACPTAGSCGIVPASLLACARERGRSRKEVVQALFTASGVGIMIGSRATLSGAEGGCQAECGSAAAMAAAAVVELCGGSPGASFHGAAMAFKNVMGLVCDPVAGLVEIPCVKRNAMGAANALLCADLALAGVESYIPFDDVLDAVKRVGKMMPECLRETALGGLAATPAARRMAETLERT